MRALVLVYSDRCGRFKRRSSRAVSPNQLHRYRNVHCTATRARLLSRPSRCWRSSGYQTIQDSEPTNYHHSRISQGETTNLACAIRLNRHRTRSPTRAAVTVFAALFAATRCSSQQGCSPLVYCRKMTSIKPPMLASASLNSPVTQCPVLTRERGSVAIDRGG